MGALAVTGGAPATDVASLVGAELPIRIGLETGLILKASQLAVAAVGDEPAVFVDPLTFGVDTAKTALRQLLPWSIPLPLTESTLTIELVATVGADTPVLVMIGDDLFTRTIPKGENSVIVPVALKQGDKHPVLVLVAGQVGRFEELTVTE
ncbi:hypothetical protein JOF56_010776 [Kibdelosporangium banguiense]|uniref:Uncharacterized protein n=1 Tax=Kibdelosporangium banguiense TaxID=1365924 RepID=A0ABS4U178_9PSEU|nr:hypothetical protein [Kibdelosporangium banguiense]MBP2330391.1 hypothetical protein [Kibdelosporangium banguiense]